MACFLFFFVLLQHPDDGQYNLISNMQQRQLRKGTGWDACSRHLGLCRHSVDGILSSRSSAGQYQIAHRHRWTPLKLTLVAVHTGQQLRMYGSSLAGPAAPTLTLASFPHGACSSWVRTTFWPKRRLHTTPACKLKLLALVRVSCAHTSLSQTCHKNRYSLGFPNCGSVLSAQTHNVFTAPRTKKTTLRISDRKWMKSFAVLTVFWKPGRMSTTPPLEGTLFSNRATPSLQVRGAKKSLPLGAPPPGRYPVC